MQDSWQKELKQRISDSFFNDDQAWLDINISTSGLLNLTIVSDDFYGKSSAQRQQQISNLINEMQAPVRLGFLSLYTQQEAENLQLAPPFVTDGKAVITWQEAAQLAANPQNQNSITSPRTPHLPRTVTFYSYKGGVGRTTALAHVAWILVMRGRKVVAVDLDLEAPGLSTVFDLSPKPQYGIVDYFYERAYSPENVDYGIPITQIFGEVRIPDATGRLFVVPAGNLDLEYVTKVDDLRATTVFEDGGNLWSTFKSEIIEQIEPDILLIDSRTGINQWGALSLLHAADEAIIFLFPNEQNRQGIDLLIRTLSSLKDFSISFVFTPVPDTTEIGMVKVRRIWSALYEQINLLDNKDIDHDISEAGEQPEEPLVVPYLPSIAVADDYPVTQLLDYYTRIANLIDEETEEFQRSEILKGPDHRWSIIESLHFPEVNAADPQQNLDLLFQKTSDFERFLDNTTCLIRGRKGTGKTALYWLLLKHFGKAQKLANGRLEHVRCFSGHGRFHDSRPSRDEFNIIHHDLLAEEGSWEAFWRAYLLLRSYQAKLFEFPRRRKGEKFKKIKQILASISDENWQIEHTKALIYLSTDTDLILVAKDALNVLDESIKSINEGAIWFLYDDLDEDFPQKNDVRKQALTGLFRLIQACDSRRIHFIRFKIFLREDIWNRLVFDNKSHFNGRDLLLQWTRVDFLKLALRQASQSARFKDLVRRFSPVESIDQASEESVGRALELLWGSRRRKGETAKYVSRWIYERLTDSSNTTFPRSLSILLRGAREHELSYENQPSIQAPTDRLLRSKSLEVGLKKASEERCNAIREEYPDLLGFLENLTGISALAEAEQLQQIWEESAQDVISPFNDFIAFLNEIGILEWRTKDQRYKFADIYVYGFQMSRVGTI